VRGGRCGFEPELTRDLEVIVGRLPRSPRPSVTVYQRGERRALTVRISGAERRAIALEEYDCGTRTGYRMALWPGPAGGTERLRVWWDDAAMRWGWLPSGRPAIPAPAGGGSAAVRSWSAARRPMLWVYAEGHWCEAVLEAREDYPDGRTVYCVGILLPAHDRFSGPLYRRYIYHPSSIQRRELGVNDAGFPFPS
jgi:hypothetical protein